MDISERKIVYKEGLRPKYIFDIIKDDPEWISLLIEGKTFHGSFELTDDEKRYYELAVLDCPQTNVRLNVDILKQALAPYFQEPIFEDERLQFYTEEVYKSIEDYNNRLSQGISLFPFRRDFETFPPRPYENFGLHSNEILIPNLYSVHHITHRYIETVKQRLQGIRSKYKKGNLSEELYYSEERLRNKLKDMEADYNAVIIGYGKELLPYFTEWKEYYWAKQEVNMAWWAFNSKCHCREYMTFGKYYNKSVCSVIRKDLGYIKWALKNSSDFILKGDDLEEFIEKAGYDPYDIPAVNSALPSDETLADLASFLGSSCDLESVVFSISHQPDIKALVSLTEKYPSLRYNITLKGDLYLITLSGNFEDKKSQSYNYNSTEEEPESAERTVREFIF